MPKFKVMIAQFPGGNQTVPDVGNWVAETVAKCHKNPEIGEGNIILWHKADTPICMTRNQCLLVAEQHGVDVVVMLDSDMRIDLPYPDAEPFWDVAWDFWRKHDGPCVIAAPYCGPPPGENVYTFRFNNSQSDDPNPNFKLEAHSRPEAAALRGVVRCGALPTGVMFIDMRAVKKLPHPRFYYEWVDETQTDKASTEDVTFSRDLTYVGVPLYATFSSWAGHWKQKLVGKPSIIPPDAVPQWITTRAAELAAGGNPEKGAAYRAHKEKPFGEFSLSPKPAPATPGTAS